MSKPAVVRVSVNKVSAKVFVCLVRGTEAAMGAVRMGETGARIGWGC